MDAAYIIERFTDNGGAVLEGASGAWEVPRAWLPNNAQEGEVIQATATQAADRVEVSLSLDVEATRQRRADLAKKRDRLKRGPKGDINL